MKICSSCGAQASTSVRKCLACGSASFLFICENCGTRFASLNCPQCGVLRESHEKICPNCGRHTFDARCPDCDRSMRDVAPQYAEIPPETYAIHTGDASITATSLRRSKPSKRKKRAAAALPRCCSPSSVTGVRRISAFRGCRSSSLR